MKYIALFIIVLIASLSTISCRLKKANNTQDKEEKIALAECLPMVLEEEPFLPVASDLFDINHAWIAANCMHVVVTYSGGCGEVDFQMYYDHRIMESHPPQTSLFLAFTDNDPCREIMQDTLQFSLFPFEAMARAGGVIFNLSGFDQKINYALPLH